MPPLRTAHAIALAPLLALGAAWGCATGNVSPEEDAAAPETDTV